MKFHNINITAELNIKMSLEPIMIFVVARLNRLRFKLDLLQKIYTKTHTLISQMIRFTVTLETDNMSFFRFFFRSWSENGAADFSQYSQNALIIINNEMGGIKSIQYPNMMHSTWFRFNNMTFNFV